MPFKFRNIGYSATKKFGPHADELNKKSQKQTNQENSPSQQIFEENSNFLILTQPSPIVQNKQEQKENLPIAPPKKQISVQEEKDLRIKHINIEQIKFIENEKFQLIRNSTLHMKTDISKLSPWKKFLHKIVNSKFLSRWLFKPNLEKEKENLKNKTFLALQSVGCILKCNRQLIFKSHEDFKLNLSTETYDFLLQSSVSYLFERMIEISEITEVPDSIDSLKNISTVLLPNSPKIKKKLTPKTGNYSNANVNKPLKFVKNSQKNRSCSLISSLKIDRIFW